MNQIIIFYPVFALVLLTFFIGFMMLRSRIAAVKSRQVSIKYFRINDGDIPEKMQRLSDHYDNLLSMPILFYLAILMMYIFHIVDVTYLVLGWAYVALRFAHTIIHTGHNNIMHRMYAFAPSMIVLTLIWLRLFAYLMIQ